MKKAIFLLWLSLLPFLSWCTSQEEVDDLNSQIYELESENNRLKETLDQCNSNIEDAQSYVWESYEDMEYALEELQTCDY